MQEGKYRDDPELIKAGLDMLDSMWQPGRDLQHGEFYYFIDVKGLPVQEYWHDMKFR